ncbi:O-antigen ligase family protein [Lawsonibacter sp. LCP25S3_G6]|uniref:O-antigen ligase family protein n=1 Tax=unclassified Lawsonibacter TaxID=2617946 RepID=UPI003F9DCED9
MKEKKIRAGQRDVQRAQFVHKQEETTGPLETWFPVWYSILLFLAMTIQTSNMALILGGLAILLSLGRNARTQIRSKAGVALLGFVAFLLLCTLGSVYTDFGSYAIKEIPKLLASGSLALLLVARGRRSSVRGVLWGFSGVCSVISLLCMDLACSGPLFQGFASLAGMLGANTYLSLGEEILISGSRMNGIYNDANLTGSLLALAIFVGVYLMVTGRNRLERLAASLLACVSVTGFVVAVSRGAILCFAVSVLAYLLLAGKENRIKVFFSLLFLGACGLASGVVASSLLTAGSTMGTWLGIPGGLLAWLLFELLGRGAAKVLEGKGRWIALVLAGAAVLGVAGVFFVFSQTEPYVFTEDSYLYRGVDVTAGESYTLTGDWDSSDGITVRVYGATREQTMLGETETYYNGPLSGAAFTVPEGISRVLLQVRGPAGVEMRSLSLSDGTQIPMAYKFLPDTIVSRLQQNLLEDSSFLLRFQYDIDGMKLFTQSPLIGHGLGSTDGLLSSVQLYYYESLYLHNHLLQVMNETGLIGLSAFLAFLLGCAWLLVKRMRTDKGDLLAPSLLTCWVMMNLHGLMEISFSIRMYQCAAFTLLLLAVVAYQEPVQGKKGFWMGVCGLAGMLLWMVVTAALILGSQMAQKEFQSIDSSNMSYSEFMSTMSRLDWMDCYTDQDYKVNMIAAGLQQGGQSGLEIAQRCAKKLMATEEFDACYRAAYYYYLPLGDLEGFFAALQTGLVQERANAEAWNSAMKLCSTVFMQLNETQVNDFVDGVLAIQTQMEQANEVLISDVALDAENQALVDAAQSVREQNLQGLEAYLNLAAAIAAVQNG